MLQQDPPAHTSSLLWGWWVCTELARPYPMEGTGAGMAGESGWVAGFPPAAYWGREQPSGAETSIPLP